MLDIKGIRSEPDRVKAAMKARNFDADALIDEMLEIDEKRRRITGTVEAMKAEQNAKTKQVPQIKKEGGDVSALMAQIQQNPELCRKLLQSLTLGTQQRA